MSEPTIAELMRRDPVSLTNDDIDSIVRELRAQRHRFLVAGDKKVGTPSERKSKAQVDREKRSKILSQDEVASLFDGL